MPIIHEERSHSEIEILCNHCEQKVPTSHHWELGGYLVCDECFNQQYSHMVKCVTFDCSEYGEPASFVNGMCDSCLEVNTPMDPEDQEGWEHNIEKWNDE